MAHVIEYREKSSTEFQEINENSLHRFLQLSGVKFSLTQLKSLLQSDYIQDFDPFIDYFKSLPEWDGHTDHIAGITSYVKAIDQQAFTYHFRKMLVRCVCIEGILLQQAGVYHCGVPANPPGFVFCAHQS